MTTAEIRCRELVELVTEYLEDAVSTDVRRRLEQHLDGCADCTEYLRQIELTIAITGRLRDHDLPAKLRAGLLSAARGRP